MANNFRLLCLTGLIFCSCLLWIFVANSFRFLGLAGFIVGLFLLWIFLDEYSKPKLRESLFRNVGVPYRNLIGLLLGATASFLPLPGGPCTIYCATCVFVVSLAITLLLL